MSDFFSTRERLRQRYMNPTKARQAPVAPAKGEALGEEGFLTEVAGRIILTAPASKFTADELPKELASRWAEMASSNPHVLWLQGRYVEAEKANRNGAFWSTEDLQFGEMTVKHGPLNWLHEEQTVVGTIADNALIHPGGQQRANAEMFHELAGKVDGISYYGPGDEYTITSQALAGITPDMFRAQNGISTTANLMGQPMPRPYIAAASAVWKWVHPEKVEVIQMAADTGKLYYSMECIAREMSCGTDETRQGCGKSFDYVTAMTQPHKTCEHIAGRTSARRMVDPSFLGGAVIVPPVQPGWGSANVEVMRQSASLAEQITQPSALKDSEWESLMASVVRFATS